MYSCLEKNVTGLPVEIYRHAVGNENTVVEMIYDSENTGGSFITTVGSGCIEIKRIDDLNLPKFGLFKIDCERHELEVLKGATETILKYKPIIVCEQQADTNFCAGEYLRSLGAREITNVRKDYIFGWE